MAKAATTIKHNGVTYKPGQALPSKEFSKEDVKALMAAGAIADTEEAESDGAMPDAPAPTVSTPRESDKK